MLNAEKSRHSSGKAVYKIFLILLIVAAGFTNLYAQNDKDETISLIEPINNQVYGIDSAGNIIALPKFIWKANAKDVFTIKIYELNQGEENEYLMKTKEPFFEQTGFFTSIDSGKEDKDLDDDYVLFEYPKDGNRFKEGKSYAWQVYSGNNKSTMNTISMGTYYLKYGDVVMIGTIISERNGSVKSSLSYQNQGIENRNFLLVNPNNLASREFIRFGDQVAIRSFINNTYLVREEADGLVNANRECIGPWEKWKFLYFFNITEKIGEKIFLSGGPTNSIAAVSIQSSYSNKFITIMGNNSVVANSNASNGVPMPNNPTAFQIVVKPWTQFYYDKPVGDTQCPCRGRWDGANCFVAPILSGSGFLYHNNFYVQTIYTNPPRYGWFDGANVQVGTNPTGVSPFIYQGSFYLQTHNCNPANPCPPENPPSGNRCGTVGFEMPLVFLLGMTLLKLRNRKKKTLPIISKLVNHKMKRLKEMLKSC